MRLAETIDAATLTEALYLLACIDLRENERDSALAHILRLRDVLAKHRLAVRVPMLVLASADWVASAGGEQRRKARRWAEAIERLEDIDATLREKAHRLLAREFGTEAFDEHDRSLSLPELEREVAHSALWLYLRARTSEGRWRKALLRQPSGNGTSAMSPFATSCKNVTSVG